MDPAAPLIERRARGFVGSLEQLIRLLGRVWDWIDRRDVDKHAAFWAVLMMTWYIVDWALEFAFQHASKPGLEIAAIVGAILLPWTPVQAAAVKWYFDSRSKGNEP